jgi:aspartyl aminopeptidase
MTDPTTPWTGLGKRFPRTEAERRELTQLGLHAASDLCAFIAASPTPFHAAAEVARRLELAGFSELVERDAWQLAPGDRRYVVRGGSILGFVVGAEAPAIAGFRVIGAHTDSPNLRVKPAADLARSGYRQVGVEVYGGALLATWLDRDLSIAGRVLVQGAGGIEARLVDLRRSVARIPNVAIHLNRGVNTEGLILNPQRHLVPIVGLGQEGSLLALLATELGVPVDAILGHDLSLYDTLAPALGGVDQEFVFSARLDNLASAHAATVALSASLSAAPATRVIALHDHEECGSRSATGAAGPMLRDVLRRIVDARAAPAPEAQAFARAVASSLLVSADMAHAVHPNYADLHEPSHAPELNRGLVIKSNANQSYATEGRTAAELTALCHRVGYEPQRFVTRSDLPCGSTIGPITAAELGIATVDVGAPMLSMHSCRELAGTLDVHLSIETFKLALTP